MTVSEVEREGGSRTLLYRRHLRGLGRRMRREPCFVVGVTSEGFGRGCSDCPSSGSRCVGCAVQMILKLHNHLHNHLHTHRELSPGMDLHRPVPKPRSAQDSTQDSVRRLQQGGMDGPTTRPGDDSAT